MSAAPAPSTTSELSPARELPAWMPLVLIAIAIAIAYSNSFQGPFVLDDIGSIPDNPSIRQLTSLNEVFTGATFATVVGRPLLNLSLAINYAIHGERPAGYHLFNLLAHIAAAWCLFGVVQQTLRLPRYSDRISPATAGVLATAIALLWGVHPLTTAAVTYTVQRCEVMAAGWYLATLYCVIRGAHSIHSRRWSILAVTCCLLGVGTKETIVTAPVVVLFYDSIFLSSCPIAAVRRRPGLYLGLFATWLPLALLMRTSGGRSETAGIGYGMSVLDYSRSQFGYVLTYLKLSVWPQPLIFDYGDQVANSWQEAAFPAFVLGFLLIALLIIGWRHPAIAFLGLSVFLILAPTSSIVPLVTQTAAEHRMYLALAFVITLIVIAAWSLLAAVAAVEPSRRKLAIIVTLILTVLLGGLTWARNRDYRTEYDLWLDTVRKRPESSRAHNNLGRVYLERGESARARDELQTALALQPDNPVSWFNLGLACEQARDYPAALKALNEAIRLRPEHALSYLHRGIVYGRLEQHDRELADLDRAVSLSPNLGEAYRQRAFAQADLGNFAAAYRDAKSAQQLGAPIPAEFFQLLEEKLSANTPR